MARASGPVGPVSTGPLSGVASFPGFIVRSYSDQSGKQARLSWVQLSSRWLHWELHFRVFWWAQWFLETCVLLCRERPFTRKRSCDRARHWLWSRTFSSSTSAEREVIVLPLNFATSLLPHNCIRTISEGLKSLVFLGVQYPQTRLEAALSALYYLTCESK